jgi:hypothetical protein
MKRYLLFLAVASVLLVGGVRADAVSDWNSIANTVFLNAARPGGV